MSILKSTFLASLITLVAITLSPTQVMATETAASASLFKHNKYFKRGFQRGVRTGFKNGYEKGEEKGFNKRLSKTKPDNFGKTFTFISSKPFDSADGTFFRDGLVAGDGEKFFKGVMGFSDQEIEYRRKAASDFLMERFGIDTNDPRVVFTGFEIDPGAQYSVLMASGEDTGEGYPILDGGFAAVVVDPNGLELGGDFPGRVVPAGTMFAAQGFYVIDRGDELEDIVISYQTRSPMQPVGDGGVIVCEVFHPEYGHGSGWGYFEFHQLTNGQTAAQVRNVLTFPAFGYAEEMIESGN